MTLTQVLVTALAFLVAGVAKGAIGMGLPPIALAIMSFAVPLESAIAMMVVPSMASNIWQAVYGGGFVRLLRALSHHGGDLGGGADLRRPGVRPARLAEGRGLGRCHPGDLFRSRVDARGGRRYRAPPSAGPIR